MWDGAFNSRLAKSGKYKNDNKYPTLYWKEINN